MVFPTCSVCATTLRFGIANALAIHFLYYCLVSFFFYKKTYFTKKELRKYSHNGRAVDQTQWCPCLK